MASNKETSIGIKLTTDLRNYQAGLNKASSETAKFSGNVKKGMGDVKGAFNGLMSGDLTQLPGFFKSATGAAGGFSNGLSGIKVALISTGIGALIVGLGLAVAALTTYFKGSEEGQLAFMRVMNSINAVIKPVVAMIGQFGKAIFELGSGNYKKAWETAKAAVGGVGDAIKKNRENLESLNTAQEKFMVTNDDLTFKSSQLQADIADLREKAADEENYNAQQRNKFINEAISKQKEYAKTQKEITQNELDFKSLKAQQGQSDLATNDEIEDIQNRQLALEKEQSTALKKLGSQRESIAKQAKKELEDREKLLKQQKEEKALGTVRMTAKLDIKIPTKDIEKLSTELQPIISKTEEWTKGVDALGRAYYNLNGVIKDSNGNLRVLQEATDTIVPAIGDGLASLGTGIGEMISGTADAGSVFDSLIGVIANFMAALGKSMIATGTAGLAFKKLLMSPGGAIVAGVGLIALSAIVSNMLQDGPEAKFAGGGIVPGSSFHGDRVLAGLNSGEMVLNKSQQSNLFSQIQNPNAGGGGGQNITVNVVGEISNDVIRLANKRAERNRNQFNA